MIVIYFMEDARRVEYAGIHSEKKFLKGCYSRLSGSISIL